MLLVIMSNRHPENIHNTILVIVVHLNSGAYVRKCIINYSYCDLTALYIHETITLNINIEIS